VQSPLPPGWTADGRSRYVHAGFVAAAARYDRLTRLFSFGLDGWWRRACLQRCELRAGLALLDVATGTGELVIHARRLLGEQGVAVGLDFCGEMLATARRKLTRNASLRVEWVEGRAEALPFPPETFDRVTVGFALRHLDLAEALREIVRVLKPDGRFVVLEWTRPERALARRCLLGYMRRVVPPLVGLLSRDPAVAELARYLPHSIEAFVSGEALTRRIQATWASSSSSRTPTRRSSSTRATWRTT
jgi:demethylmenaquinone methyltransferase/2-methoxy-6-polyprenyl-1,4-benzoquinol methylase